METLNDKKSLRRSIKEFNRSITPHERLNFAKLLLSRVECHPLWESSTMVLLFSSLPDEIDTTPLLDLALVQGKHVVLPVVCGDHLELYHYDPERLCQGAFGIIEPDPRHATPVTHYEEIDLAIIPGIAFTAHGDRLGRGKGYYDRLLPLLHCPTIGIGYPHQLVELLPTEDWDIPLTEIII